jgi:hypothetical protein
MKKPLQHLIAEAPRKRSQVRTGDAGVEEGSQWEGRHDGAQALTGECLEVSISYWE